MLRPLERRSASARSRPTGTRCRASSRTASGRTSSEPLTSCRLLPSLFSSFVRSALVSVSLSPQRASLPPLSRLDASVRALRTSRPSEEALAGSLSGGTLCARPCRRKPCECSVREGPIVQQPVAQRHVCRGLGLLLLVARLPLALDLLPAEDGVERLCRDRDAAAEVSEEGGVVSLVPRGSAEGGGADRRGRTCSAP